MIGGTRAKEAQAIGVDRGRQSVLLEGSAEKAEVVPCGVGPDKASAHDQSRVIIDAQEQGLLGRIRPPLMDAAVVLPEFPGMGAAEATIGPHPARGGWHQPCKMLFYIGLDAGSGAVKAAKPLHLIGDELIVRRVLQRQEALQKAMHRRWPYAVVVATAGPRLIAGFVAQPRGAQLIETTAADLKIQRGAGGIEFAVIEGAEDAADIGLGEPAADLFFFMSRSVTSLPAAPTHNLAPRSRGQPPHPRSFAHWARRLEPRYGRAAAPVALQQSRILPVLPHLHAPGKPSNCFLTLT